MRYQQVVEGPHGWSDWIQPRHALYKLRCCDCGLVHDLQFRVVKNRKGAKFVSIGEQAPGKVIFRARRNNRATAAVRRRR